jgi:pyridoxamine 5'-phosphate oxidase
MTEKPNASKSHFLRKILSEKNVSPDPVKQFSKWYSEIQAEDYPEPTAVTLATASKSGIPSARVVLLKHYDENGYIFYTNYQSRKGRELAENPNACLLFYWDKFARQVRIEGVVRKCTQKESEEYFRTRPFKSRLGVWASHQSSVIENRTVIVKEFLKYFMKFGRNVPLPSYWGGYILTPEYFEFWQGRPNRLHDRIAYKKQKSGWKIFRLAP